MKSTVTLLFALMLTTPGIFAQALPKKPPRSEVGSFNQANLLKIDIGVSKDKVLEVIGGIQKIQTYTSTSFMTKKESIVIIENLLSLYWLIFKNLSFYHGRRYLPAMV